MPLRLNVIMYFAKKAELYNRIMASYYYDTILFPLDLIRRWLHYIFKSGKEITNFYIIITGDFQLISKTIVFCNTYLNIFNLIRIIDIGRIKWTVNDHSKVRLGNEGHLAAAVACRCLSCSLRRVCSAFPPAGSRQTMPPPTSTHPPTSLPYSCIPPHPPARPRHLIHLATPPSRISQNYSLKGCKNY